MLHPVNQHPAANAGRPGDEVRAVRDVLAGAQRPGHRLRGPEKDFKQFLTEGPPYFDDLELERSTELSRPIDLE